MAFHTNPRYLDGHHTVRLSEGLGVEHLISVYDWNFDSLDDGYEEGLDGLRIHVVMGKATDVAAFVDAAQETFDNGSFS